MKEVTIKMDNRAIGYIDSGIGGLTVVKQALEQLPNEQIYYIGDTARMPYGARTQEEVLRFTWQMVNYLLKKEIKLLVIACNTATAAALPDLQAKLSIPVIGVIQPGVTAALQATKNQHIGVIATKGTVESLAYQNKLEQQGVGISVEQLATPDFVTIVENYDYTDFSARQRVLAQLAYFDHKNIDTLILGCTHFPLLAPFIKEAMGEKVTLINSGAEAVTLVQQALQNNDIMHDLSVVDHSMDMYCTTGSVERFAEVGGKWLEMAHMPVRHLDILNDQLV